MLARRLISLAVVQAPSTNCSDARRGQLPHQVKMTRPELVLQRTEVDDLRTLRKNSRL